MEVKIELGHKAWKNVKPTKEGYTHDWTVFVQGVNGSEIRHFVEKVIFHLPDSYPDPIRMKEKPPYVLSESTSRNLSIQIDVFFCTEATLRKVHYIYDIFISDEVVNISWEKKLAFPNPSKEFKEKLLLAGGELVDLLKTIPVMTGEFLKIKDEPIDEIQIVNNVDEATLNTAVQKIDNFQNKCNTSREGQLNFSKLLEENKNLKNANIEVKEKIDHQEKLMTYYEEHFSRYEANISNTNLGINQLKEKIEADEREINTLKLQLQMLKNKLLRIQNSSQDLPEKRTRGRKRKNKEDLNISAADGKEKENATHPAKFLSSYSSTSQNSSLFKNAFVSIENQNVCETDKSSSAISVVQNASVSETAIELNDMCNILSGNCLPSHSENETQSLNDNSSNQQNLCKNQDSEALDCSKDVSSVVTFSFKSTNTCDVEKSFEGNSDKTHVSLNKPDLKNNDVEKPVNRSSVKINSLNTPEIIIIDAEKPAKRISAKANNSLNSPEIITIDSEESTKGSSDKASHNTPEIIIIEAKKSTKGSCSKTNVSLNTPEIIIIDGEKSAKGMSAKANVSLNKPDARNNYIEKPVYGSSVQVNSSLNTPKIIIDPVKSEKRSPANANTSLNTFDLRNNDVKKIVEGNSLEVPTSVSKLHIKPCSTNKTQEQFGTPIQELHVSSTERANINSSNLNCKQNGKLSNFGDAVISSLTPNNTKPPKKKKKKNLKKGRNIVERLCLPLEALTSANKLHTEPCSINKTQEQHSSSIKRTNINSNSNCEEKKMVENGKKIPDLGVVVFSSLTPSNTKLPKRQRKRKGYMQNFRDVFQSEMTCISSVCKESHQDLNDTSAPKLTSFLTEHCQKLATELGRIKNSEFSKYREGTNSLFYKLENIDTNQITDECFKQYVHSLIDYFSDPKTFDMPTLIYLVVDYLSRDRVNHESLYTYLQNQDICVFIQPSENCIVHALHEVERKSLPHLNGLIRNTLNIIHQVIISKKKMAPNGLASLCRVFMEICKCKNDRSEPLFLCCELLRLGHPLAPYLINTLAAVWRNPFSLYDNFSAEENMLLGSINYGMKEKPLLMDYDLWKLTFRLRSTYFPRPFIINTHQAIQFLTTEIVSRCAGGLLQDLWMLTSPLVIFVSKESWEWKLSFKNGYLVPKLLHFSSCSNEQGFDLFCNLYVDIFSCSPESPYEEILQYFTNTELHQGVKFIQDCAVVALLKYIGTADKHIPAPLRDWFLRNQDNPKLAVLIDLYCKKVMESHDSFLLWDDIIIV